MLAPGDPRYPGTGEPNDVTLDGPARNLMIYVWTQELV